MELSGDGGNVLILVLSGNYTGVYNCQISPD